MLKTFGYPYTIELATRPDKALGTPEIWQNAQKTLADALNKRGQSFTYDEGGGTFYGPKLDFKLIDAIGRKWQGPTVQLDFNLPERFGLEYTGADNAAHRPIMLHRVLVGSMERFVGGLIEHFAGAFPLWLAPEQVRVIPIADEVKGFAQTVVDRLKAAGVRVHLDDRSDTLNYKIREGEMLKIPYMAVVGKREAEADSIALRVRGAGKKQEILTVGEFLSRIQDELVTRALKP
jgi:threonyl-tRNA synthetase